MILKDLVKEIPFEEMKERFTILYPGYMKSIKGYKSVYKLLLKKRPTKSTTIIDIEWIDNKDADGGGGYWDVHGKEPNDDTKWALDLSSFSKWLGFTIGPEVPLRKDKATLLCHILWEMTFHGFSDKEIQKLTRSLKKSMKEIKEGKGKFREITEEDFK